MALSKKTLVKNWLLTYSSETCYNYERLQGLGNTNAFVPVIRELYPEDKQAEELKKYLVFYNTEPSWMGTIINGITCAMEEKRAEGADISADDIMLMRSSLMGPWQHWRHRLAVDCLPNPRRHLHSACPCWQLRRPHHL